jgi:serine/threonine protein kinase
LSADNGHLVVDSYDAGVQLEAEEERDNTVELAPVEGVESWYDSGVRLEPSTALDNETASSAKLDLNDMVIIDRIGEGTQSEVLLCTFPGDKKVAAKLGLKKGAIRREDAVLSVMSGVPGFPKVLLHEPEGPLAPGGILVMPLLGQSLNDLEGPVLGKDVLPLGRGMVKLLRQLHFAGFVHNDVKPANILRSDGSARWHLIDFGSCTLTSGPAPEGDALFCLPGPIGTARFASLAVDKRKTETPRPVSDIESLVYTLLACMGSLPWQTEQERVILVLKRDLLEDSAVAAEFFEGLPCPKTGAALQKLWDEVKRCTSDSTASVDYEACLDALGGGSESDAFADTGLLAALPCGRKGL